MRILVGIKRVLDYTLKARVKPDKTGVDLSNQRMGSNPFCDIALEEAVRLKEAGKVSEVVAVSVGPKTSAETLRSALALGADRAIHVLTDIPTDLELQPRATAGLLEKVVRDVDPNLVLLGKQSIDGDYCQTGAMLAAGLGWPQAMFACRVTVAEGGDEITVERETDTGTQTLAMNLPAIVTADLRLNEPRYASLPNILKAKKKNIDVLDAVNMGVNLEARNKVLKVEEPPVRKGGVLLKDTQELYTKLRENGFV